MSSGLLVPVHELFNRAVDAFAKGDLTQAANLCARMPIGAPNYANSRHLSAVIAGRQGDAKRAMLFMAEYCCLSPADADAFADFAVIAGNAGLPKLALDAALRAIRLTPDHPDRLQNAALLAIATHRHDLALACWQILTRQHPQQADFWYKQAQSEIELGQSDGAIASLAQVTRLDPGHAGAFEQLGRLLFAGKRLGEAAYAFREWTRLRQNDANAYLNYGVVLTELGGQNEASLACAQSIVLGPSLFAAYTNLAAALYLKQLDFHRAYRLIDRANRLNPHSADVQMNLAVTLQGLGQTSEAHLAFCRAAVIRPADDESLYNQSLFELLHGNFRDGLRFYEWRRSAGVGIMTRFDQPMWRGENLRGRHLFIADEQGLGDTLQFCRYVPMVLDMGARVTLSVRPALVDLLRTVSPDLTVLSQTETPPAFDCWTSMMSLPFLFGTELHTIPSAVPYLHIDSNLVAKAGLEIVPSAKKKIGLVWSGSTAHKNDHNRSIPLSQLRPLFDLPDFDFYVLQTEIRASDQAILSALDSNKLKPIAKPDSSFLETAARIRNMDLVISVDTSVAHLCGALGKEVWILLTVNPDWRWLLDRTDSPWYPTARLFRQSQIGDWGPVLDDVRKQLLALS